MKKVFNIGVIGAGMIAEVHIQNLIKTGRAQISWINAKTQTSVDKVAAKYSIPNKTTDYNELLASKEIDAVVITAPPVMHKEMFMAAVKAGKHILLEKPVAMSLTEIDEMLAFAATRPDLKISGCSARHARLQPKYQKVKEIIESGILGDIYFLHHNAVRRQERPGIEYHPSAKWFLNKAIAGGGPMFDWGVYDLSFHLGLLNDVPELIDVETLFVKSGLDRKDPGTAIYDTEEHFAVRMKLTGGIDYYWERASHANVEAPNETRIYGTKGGIKLQFCTWDSPDIHVYTTSDEGRGHAQTETITVDMQHQDDGFELSKHLIAVLDGDVEPLMPLSLSRKHLDIIFRCYQSAGILS